MSMGKRLIMTLITFVSISISSCGQDRADLDSGYNKLLANQLESVLAEDQRYRQMISSVEAEHGLQSDEMKELFDKMRVNDSLNTLKVTAILDRHGWLGPKEIGEEANSCLFLVIQHAGLKIQEKYLPIMRNAVELGKAREIDLAYLEDRVAVEQGRKQIYGTQLYRNRATGNFYFAPIEDEPNVNRRRMGIGLEPIEDRAKELGFDYKAPSN